jgi:hypothetical protein
VRTMVINEGSHPLREVLELVNAVETLIKNKLSCHDIINDFLHIFKM